MRQYLTELHTNTYIHILTLSHTYITVQSHIIHRDSKTCTARRSAYTPSPTTTARRGTLRCVRLHCFLIRSSDRACDVNEAITVCRSIDKRSPLIHIRILNKNRPSTSPSSSSVLCTTAATTPRTADFMRRPAMTGALRVDIYVFGDVVWCDRRARAPVCVPPLPLTTTYIYTTALEYKTQNAGPSTPSPSPGPSSARRPRQSTPISIYSRRWRRFTPRYCKMIVVVMVMMVGVGARARVGGTRSRRRRFQVLGVARRRRGMRRRG